MIRSTRLLAASLVFLPVALDIAAAGDLFDNVASTLESRYYDRDFARDELPGLIDRYRPQADDAANGRIEREIVFEFLSHIPASHLGLLTESAHQAMLGELFGEPGPTLGVELSQRDGVFYARAILEDGPADEAGVLIGDVIITIDGAIPQNSTRLDYRTDDAALPDEPRHSILVAEGDAVELVIERSPGERETVSIVATSYPALRATRASAEIIEHDNARIAYVHFWYIHHHTLDELFKQLVEGPFADADGMVLDLRGRGGSAAMVARLVALFAQGIWEKPLAVLIDAETRSGKEVLAYEMKRKGIGRFVGETTAGAVLPATFQPVGDGLVLMFPQFLFGDYSTLIEGKGVAPDVPVESFDPYAAGEDTIRRAGLDEAARLVAESTAPVAADRQRNR